MKKLIKALLVIAVLLFVASCATCYFGVEHEINKIPAERRAQVSDFDWIGIEWIMRGMVISLIAFICAFAAIALWIVKLLRGRAGDVLR